MQTLRQRSSPLSIAIVGAGLTGRWHAFYSPRAGGRVVAIVDSDLLGAQLLARRLPAAAAFASMSDCLASTRLDAVHVCTPASTHFRLSEEALSAGAHVLVEKPLAPGALETSRLLEIAADKNLILTAVHQFPFQRGARRLDADRNALGRLLRLDFSLSSAGGAGLRGPERQEALLGLLPHPLSLFRLFLGGLPEAQEWLAQRRDEDGLELTSRWRDVSLGIRLSWLGRPTRCQLTALGTEGTARLDLFHGFCSIENERSPSRLTKASAPFRSGGRLLGTAFVNLVRRALSREPAFPGLPQLIRRFYASIETGAEPPVSPEEILAVSRLIDRLRGGASG